MPRTATKQPPHAAAARAARRFITLDDAAEYLAVSPLTVRRRIASGELKAYRLGRSRTIRLDLADVENMLRPIPTAGGGAAC